MSLRTVPNALAAPSTDQNANPSTAIDRAYAVQVTPAASPVARGNRSVVQGSYPVWLVQTDQAGVEKVRVLVSSAAPVYMQKGTGDRWYLAAASTVASGTDAAYDVTLGDDPGDWMEYASSPPIVNKEIIIAEFTNQTVAQGLISETLLVPPTGTRTAQLVAYRMGTPGGSIDVDLLHTHPTTGVKLGTGLGHTGDGVAFSDTINFSVSDGGVMKNVVNPLAAIGSLAQSADKTSTQGVGTAIYGVPPARGFLVRLTASGSPITWTAAQRTIVACRWS